MEMKANKGKDLWHLPARKHSDDMGWADSFVMHQRDSDLSGMVSTLTSVFSDLQFFHCFFQSSPVLGRLKVGPHKDPEWGREKKPEE